MDYVAHYAPSEIRPSDWAAAREAERVWAGLSASDHCTAAVGAGPVPWRHLFVTLTEMASVTNTVHLSAGFANNLARSPVEFAQASLALQDYSLNRYEAALGAGWAEDEIVARGEVFPPNAARARRFRESLLVLRDLLRTGECSFSGEHYTIELSGLGPLTAVTPPLIAAVAGPWTMANIPPIVDQVELSIPGAANPMSDGKWDMSRMGQLKRDDLARACDRVREANPEVAISCAVVFGLAVGPDSPFAAMKESLGDGFIGSCFGEPAQVAETLDGLSTLGISRLTMMATTPDGHSLLAAQLPAVN